MGIDTIEPRLQTSAVKQALFNHILKILTEATNNDLLDENLDLTKSVTLTQEQLEGLVFTIYMLVTEK